MATIEEISSQGPSAFVEQLREMEDEQLLICSAGRGSCT